MCCVYMRDTLTFDFRCQDREGEEDANCCVDGNLALGYKYKAAGKVREMTGDKC